MNAATKKVFKQQVHRPLVIGLINNMSLSAMASAQAQFAGLLRATGRPVELICFTMRQMQDGLCNHLPIHALAEYGVDAIIVTGMEISEHNLRNEWLWNGFTHLHDWAEQESVPAIWSCLAAHAAVLHRDGIERKPLGPKLSGVFTCRHAAIPHRLTNGLPENWQCPHSRYNGLASSVLESYGYTIVSQGNTVGADIFTRSASPGTFYFQGHLEYFPETLLHEFLRDLRRFISGESAICPAVPATYLDSSTENTLTELRAEALSGRDVMESARTCAKHAVFHNDWSKTAVQIYNNWLDIVAEHANRQTNWLRIQDGITSTGDVRP